MNAPSNEKSRLERKEELAGMWMYGGMFLVFAGVVVETVPEFTGTSGWFLSRAHRFGSATIAIGLAIEFVVELVASKYRGKLREINDGLISELNARAAQAIERAAKAEQAASEANLARAKLEAKVTRRSISRSLTEDERASMIKNLRTFAGQTFTLRMSNTPLFEAIFENKGGVNMEHQSFTLELQSTLLIAGWVHDNVVNMPSPPVLKGLSLFVAQEGGAHDAATTLAIELAKFDIACQIAITPEHELPLVIGVGLL